MKVLIKILINNLSYSTFLQILCSLFYFHLLIKIVLPLVSAVPISIDLQRLEKNSDY